MISFHHKAVRKKQHIFYILVLQSAYLLQSQELPIEKAAVYVIREINYVITGKTTEAALERAGEFTTGERFAGQAELDKYIKATMKHAQGCQIEFLSREVPSIHGDLGRLKKAVEIMRKAVEEVM